MLALSRNRGIKETFSLQGDFFFFCNVYSGSRALQGHAGKLKCPSQRELRCVSHVEKKAPAMQGGDTRTRESQVPQWTLCWKQMEAATVEDQASLKSEELLPTSHPQEEQLFHHRPSGTAMRSLMVDGSAARAEEKSSRTSG